MVYESYGCYEGLWFTGIASHLTSIYLFRLPGRRYQMDQFIFIMQGLCYVVDITVVLTTFIITFDFIFNLMDFPGFTNGVASR